MNGPATHCPLALDGRVERAGREEGKPNEGRCFFEATSLAGGSAMRRHEERQLPNPPFTTCAFLKPCLLRARAILGESQPESSMRKRGVFGPTFCAEEQKAV